MAGGTETEGLIRSCDLFNGLPSGADFLFYIFFGPLFMDGHLITSDESRSSPVYLEELALTRRPSFPHQGLRLLQAH